MYFPSWGGVLHYRRVVCLNSIYKKRKKRFLKFYSIRKFKANCLLFSNPQSYHELLLITYVDTSNTFLYIHLFLINPTLPQNLYTICRQLCSWIGPFVFPDPTWDTNWHSKINEERRGVPKFHPLIQIVSLFQSISVLHFCM